MPIVNGVRSGDPTCAEPVGARPPCAVTAAGPAAPRLPTVGGSPPVVAGAAADPRAPPVGTDRPEPLVTTVLVPPAVETDWTVDPHPALTAAAAAKADARSAQRRTIRRVCEQKTLARFVPRTGESPIRLA